MKVSADTLFRIYGNPPYKKHVWVEDGYDMVCRKCGQTRGSMFTGEYCLG